MRFLRNHWYHFTIIAFIAGTFYMLFWGVKTLLPIQIILVASFLALLAHQFEEYVFPGGGPLVVNIGTWKETQDYTRYPGNTLSGLLVNTSAYVFYLAAIFYPQWIWLGLATMFFNLMQFIGHGILMNRALKTWYNPGLATVIFLLIPISVYYMLFVTSQHLVTGWDWAYGALTFVLSTIFTIVLPVQLLKNRNSPYEISQWQVDRFNEVRAFASLKK